MKNLFLLLFISTVSFGQQIPGGRLVDGSVTEVKLANDALRPVNAGTLTDFALVFGTDYRKKYTLAVTSDIALSLSGATQTADSYIFISTVPDGTHVVSFPSDWSIKNNAVFDPTKTQRIELYYDGNKVYVDIFNADAIVIAELTAASITGGTDDITLTFDNPVTITTAGWTLTASGGAVTVSSVVSGSGTNSVVFDLSRNITAGEDVTIDYDPVTGATVSSTGNELAIISDRFVDTGSAPPTAFCDITVCATGGDYTTGQAASDAAVAGQTICFCAGTYRETIVGKTGVTYRNVPGEVAIISGLNDVGNTGWTVHSGNIYKKTITLPLSGNFSTGDLTSNTTLMANQIFKGSDMMMLAGWPKMANADALMDRNNFRYYSSTQGLTATQVTDSGLPATGNLAGAHITIMGWFFTQTRQISARSGNVITYPQVSTDLHFVKWYRISNHLDLLTQANEWMYTGGILYAWQTGGGSPTGLQYKARNWGFDLRGRDNVVIQGLHFIGCEPATGDTNTDGCTIDNIRATYTNHAFTQQGGDLIYRSPIMHGIKLLGNNNTIKNSEFKYCASQLIWAGENALIQNNLASDISYEGNYGAFVTPHINADGCRILYNTASRLGRSAVDFGYDGPSSGGAGYGGSQAHLNIEVGYNIFHTYLMLNHDGGATYGARGTNLDGLVIHHNWIYNNTVADHWADADANASQPQNVTIPPQQSWYGVHAGIYFDQGAGPGLMHHNVLWDGSTVDTFMQPLFGRVSRWYNNTFASDMPRTKWTFATWYTNPGDIWRNNLVVGYININHAAGLGDLRNNLLTTENSNQPAGNNNVINNSPSFVGPTTVGVTNGENFAINSGSPARNIGVVIAGITDGYEGVAPDAGAYEFGVTNWVPGYVAGGGEDEDYIVDGTDMTFPVGTWTHASGQSYTLAPTFTISYSATTNAELEGTFAGTVVKLYSEKFNTHGIVEVKIDGVRMDCDPGTGGVQDCDLYQNTTSNNSQLIATWDIADGNHTYEQKLVGVNGAATGTGLNMFDYLLVTPNP